MLLFTQIVTFSVSTCVCVWRAREPKFLPGMLGVKGQRSRQTHTGTETKNVTIWVNNNTAARRRETLQHCEFASFNLYFSTLKIRKKRKEN